MIKGVLTCPKAKGNSLAIYDRWRTGKGARSSTSLLHSSAWTNLTIEVRVQHMPELIAIFDEAFAKHGLAYWCKVLTEHDIPHPPICNYEEIADDAQMAATDVFVEVDHPRFERFRTVDSPMTIEGAAKVRLTAAPELGEHTRKILESLDYSEDEI